MRGSFGLILAADVLYNQDVALDPAMLARFVGLLDWSLDSTGVAIIGFVERNVGGLADVGGAGLRGAGPGGGACRPPETRR